MKVIFISEVPFIEQNKKDMYYKELSDNFKTEIWDLSLIYNRNYELPDMAKEAVKVGSFNELKRKLEKLPKGSIFITSSRAYGISLKSFKLINKMGHKVFYFKKEMVVDEVRKHYNLVTNKNLFKKISEIKLNKLSEKILRKLKNRIIGKYEYDYSFQISSIKPYKAKNIIKGHNIKYQEYLNTLNEEKEVKNDYILFLDVDLAYHHDILKDKTKENIEPKKYFKKMNELFNKVEKKYGVEVIISAHPKSNYKNEFNNRKIIKYKTPNLIINSKGVIGHNGTSIATAVLAKKPLLFPYYPEMLEKACKDWIQTSNGFANYLKVPFINLDEMNYSIDFHYNEERYEKFINELIIAVENIGLKNEEVIISEFKKNNREMEGN